MRLSIVTTMYNSAPDLSEFYMRAATTAEAFAQDVEFIFVNDGSPDNSLDLALNIQKRDPRVTVIDLSRNFGHHKAMMTGLSHARGDLIFLIDCDLEERPELLADFYGAYLSNKCDVVYGVQKSRRGTFFDRFAGEAFFRIVELLSDRRLPRSLVTARLMTRDYVRALVRHRDREFVIADLWQLTGFHQRAISIEKLSHSPSNYSLAKRIGMAIRFITVTSSKILYIFLYLGLVIFGISVGVIAFFLTRYFTTGIGVDGFTSIIVSIWFLGGLITLILGVFGIYIANILSETKRRPYTLVRKVYRSQ